MKPATYLALDSIYAVMAQSLSRKLLRTGIEFSAISEPIEFNAKRSLFVFQKLNLSYK